MVHMISLGHVQAELWAETCRDLGLHAGTRKGEKLTQVMANGSKEELEAAWEIFIERVTSITAPENGERRVCI